MQRKRIQSMKRLLFIWKEEWGYAAGSVGDAIITDAQVQSHLSHDKTETERVEWQRQNIRKEFCCFLFCVLFRNKEEEPEKQETVQWFASLQIYCGWCWTRSQILQWIMFADANNSCRKSGFDGNVLWMLDTDALISHMSPLRRHFILRWGSMTVTLSRRHSFAKEPQIGWAAAAILACDRKDG